MAHSVLAGNYFTQIVAVMQQPTEKPLKVDNTLSLFLHIPVAGYIVLAIWPKGGLLTLCRASS